MDYSSVCVHISSVLYPKILQSSQPGAQWFSINKSLTVIQENLANRLVALRSKNHDFLYPAVEQLYQTVDLVRSYLGSKGLGSGYPTAETLARLSQQIPSHTISQLISKFELGQQLAQKAFIRAKYDASQRLEAIQLDIGFSTLLKLNQCGCNYNVLVDLWCLKTAELYSDKEFQLCIQLNIKFNWQQLAASKDERKRLFSALEDHFVNLISLAQALRPLGTPDQDLLSKLYKAIKYPTQLAVNYHCILQSLPDREDISCSKSVSPIEQEPLSLFANLLRDHYKEAFGTVTLMPNDADVDIDKLWAKLTLEDQQCSSENYGLLLDQATKCKEPAVLRGVAGVGKSTLLKRIAFDWANGKLENLDLLIYAKLSKVPTDPSALIEQCLAWIQSYKKRYLLPSEFKKIKEAIVKHVQEGNLKLLLLADDVREFPSTTSYPFSLIFASRPSFAKLQNEFTLTGMSTAEQKGYIGKFCENKPDSKALEADLNQWLSNNPHMHWFSRIPLLLQFICVAFSSKALKPIGTLTDLYRSLVMWLIKDTMDDLDNDEKEEYGILFSKHWMLSPCVQKLASLAIDGLLEDRYWFDQQEASQIDPICFEMGFVEKKSRQVGERAEQVVEFWHESFQEYFAAIYVADKIGTDVSETLVQRFRDKISCEEFVNELNIAGGDLLVPFVFGMVPNEARHLLGYEGRPLPVRSILLSEAIERESRFACSTRVLMHNIP